MSRNTGLATVGGALFVSALQAKEANAFKYARRDVLFGVDRTLIHARRQAVHASTTATLLVGVALVAYVVKDLTRTRIETRASEANADAVPAIAARVTSQLHRVTDRVATDVRVVTDRVIRSRASGDLPSLDRVTTPSPAQ